MKDARTTACNNSSVPAPSSPCSESSLEQMSSNPIDPIDPSEASSAARSSSSVIGAGPDTTHEHAHGRHNTQRRDGAR
eukprot:scaffold35310_cov72-Phaeocystis_antarctica.AAC.3